MIDGAGDDSYRRGVFSQATGFWWSMGMLVDFGGNDVDYIPKKSAGGGDMNAIGLLSDKAGTDKYYPTSQSSPPTWGSGHDTGPKGEGARS